MKTNEKYPISIDNTAINNTIQSVESLPEKVQLLYDTLLKTGLKNITLNEVTRIISLFNNKHTSFAESYIKDLLINQSDKEISTQFMGLPIEKEKLKELIKIPNIQEIEKTAQTIYTGYLGEITTYCIIQNDTIQLKEDYPEQIKESYTVYAIGENQITKAKEIEKVVNLMNEYLENIDFIHDFPNDIPGIAVKDKSRCKIDETYIKRF